jgi:hypothetical protein
LHKKKREDKWTGRNTICTIAHRSAYDICKGPDPREKINLTRGKLPIREEKRANGQAEKLYVQLHADLLMTCKGPDPREKNKLDPGQIT